MPEHDTQFPGIADQRYPRFTGTVEEQERAQEFAHDLNPDLFEGENYGTQGPHPEKTAKTAYDVKGAHDRLNGIEDDDLKQIPIMPPGSRLEQGATYIDLREMHPKEFTATGDMSADGDHWYVPKSSVPYWIWNQLIGVQNPERLDSPSGR